MTATSGTLLQISLGNGAVALCGAITRPRRLTWFYARRSYFLRLLYLLMSVRAASRSMVVGRAVVAGGVEADVAVNQS